MTTGFDWSKYETETPEEKPSEPSETFNWAKYDPEASSPASTLVREFTSGAGGIIPDIYNLAKATGVIGQFLPEAEGTHEISKAIQEKTGGREPLTAGERYAESVGRFAGQEAALGGIVGGGAGLPGAATGAGYGALHGAYTGLVYQIARELGLSDEAAMGAAFVFSASPIALREVAPKVWSKIQKYLPKKPPGPPGGGPPPVPPEAVMGKVEGALKAEELPRSRFETAEKAVEELRQPIEGKPLGVEVAIETPKEGKSLQGRVSPEPKLGEVVTKEAFESEAQGGRQLSEKIKEVSKEERKPFEEQYKKAEENFGDAEAVFEELVDQNEEMITEMEKSKSRNPAEEAFYQELLKQREILGTYGEYRPVRYADLLKTSNSISGRAAYEPLYIGVKGLFRKLSKNINDAVIKVGKANGIDVRPAIEGDKMYGRWADRFLNDWISPYLDKTQLNPEKLFRQTISDEGNYRAVKNAIGRKKDPLFRKVDRALVEEKMGKYYKKPELVNSEEYIADLKNINELVGKDETANIDAVLRKKKAEFEKTKAAKKVIRETAEITKPRPSPKLKEFAEKIAKQNNLLPEDVLKQLDSRSGIRDLRKKLPERTFDQLGKQKARSILQEGNVTKEAEASDWYKTLNKESNYEVFSELFGKEETDALLEATKKASESKDLAIKNAEVSRAINTAIVAGIVTKTVGAKALSLLKILISAI